MTLISKPNYNQIFASNAPSIDTPAAFANYDTGWAESRNNNGKPTIKQFNYIHQNQDLKALWILQNGACLPYDAAIEYAEGSLSLKDGIIQQYLSGAWGVYKTSAANVTTQNGETQQEINDYIGTTWYARGGGYQINDKARLADGTIVISTIPSNTNDPNSDMTGWVLDNAASQIIDESGKSQQELNEKLKRGYVTPYDFGYADGLDYGYYLQLAINSGNTVKGSFKNEVVTAKTSVKITTNGQSVDLSMISVNLDNIDGASDRSKSFVNVEPAVMTAFNWISSSGLLPTTGSISFTVVDATSLNIGDYIIISVTHATENGTSYPAFITAKSGNTLTTTHVFGTNPATLRVSKVDYLRSPKVKMPQKVVDLSTETSDTSKMVGGLLARRVVFGEFYGTELINGANPSYAATHCFNCDDFNFCTTNPRVWGSGQGYVNQISYSTFMESHNPSGYRSRHVIDYTGGGYNKNYNAKDPMPRHTPINTHGAYEHDCDFISPKIGDCSGVAGGYAVYFAGADAYFGNVSVRCRVIDADCGGGFNMSAKSQSCDITGNFKTAGFNQASCVGGVTLEVDTNNTGVIIRGESSGDLHLTNSSIANLVIQDNVDHIHINASSVKDMRTDGAVKPKSITVSGDSKLNPTLSASNIIAVQEKVSIANTNVVSGAVNAGYYFDCPIVSINSDVKIKNSVNFHAVASNYYEFNGKFEDVDTRTTRTPNIPLVQQRSETGLLLMTNPVIRTSGSAVSIVPFRVASTSQTFISKGLIINGGYIEGVTEVPNHVTLGKLDTISINGALFKDDSAILAITQTSKIKINGIKL